MGPDDPVDQSGQQRGLACSRRRMVSNERYDRSLEVYPICRRWHLTLHMRFGDPEPWLDLLHRHGKGGTWVELLSLDPRYQFEPFGETYPDGLPAAGCVNIAPDIATSE